MSRTRQERPAQRASNFLDSIRTSTSEVPNYVSDLGITLWQYKFEADARKARKEIKERLANNPENPHNDELQELLEIISVLKKLPALISREARGNIGFLSADKNKCLPADKALLDLLELLVLPPETIRAMPEFFQKCQENVKVLQALANDPATFSGTGYALETVFYSFAIVMTAALMVAFLYVTPMLTVGACIVLATLALGLLVEFGGFLHNLIALNQAYEVLNYVAEILPAKFELPAQNDVQNRSQADVLPQPEPVDESTLYALQPQSPSYRDGFFSIMARMPGRGFSAPSIGLMAPPPGM